MSDRPLYNEMADLSKRFVCDVLQSEHTPSPDTHTRLVTCQTGNYKVEIFHPNRSARLCLAHQTTQKEIYMKKIAQVTATLLMVLFLSIGNIARADDPQDAGDNPRPTCDPRVRVCPGSSPSSSTVPQVGTVTSNSQITYNSFLDLLLLYIRLELGL